MRPNPVEETSTVVAIGELGGDLYSIVEEELQNW